MGGEDLSFCLGLAMTEGAVRAALTFFRSLKTFRLTFLRMRNKCKIINIQRKIKHFQYKYHELFVNSPVPGQSVVITVNSFLKCRSMQ